jgi:hypothetical protein
MKTVKLDKWPSAQMQPMNDNARAQMIREEASANGGIYRRPGLPDALWRAATAADMVASNPILAELTYK